MVIAADVEPIVRSGGSLEVAWIDRTWVAIFQIGGSLKVEGKWFCKLSWEGNITQVHLISSVIELSPEAMLSNVVCCCWGVRLRPSEARELVKAVVKELARNSINGCIDVVWDEAWALDGEDLASSLVPLSGINRGDLSDGLGLVASRIIVVASYHLLLVVQSIAYSELEVDACRLVGSDGSHDTSHLGLRVGLQVGRFLKETFEVDSIAIDAGLNEGKLRQKLALLLLSLSGVEPKWDRRAVVDHGG